MTLRAIRHFTKTQSETIPSPSRSTRRGERKGDEDLMMRGFGILLRLIDSDTCDAYMRDREREGEKERNGEKQ